MKQGHARVLTLVALAIAAGCSGDEAQQAETGTPPAVTMNSEQAPAAPAALVDTAADVGAEAEAEAVGASEPAPAGAEQSSGSSNSAAGASGAAAVAPPASGGVGAAQAAAAAPPAEEAASEPSPRTGPLSVYDGVYTVAQAARGEQVQQRECGACHAPNEWAGGRILGSYSGRTVFDFVHQLRATMPMDGPGRLSLQEYTDVVTYMLQLNSIPAGEQELPATEEDLRLVRLEYRR